MMGAAGDGRQAWPARDLEGCLQSPEGRRKGQWSDLGFKRALWPPASHQLWTLLPWISEAWRSGAKGTETWRWSSLPGLLVIGCGRWGRGSAGGGLGEGEAVEKVQGLSAGPEPGSRGRFGRRPRVGHASFMERLLCAGPWGHSPVLAACCGAGAAWTRPCPPPPCPTLCDLPPLCLGSLLCAVGPSGLMGCLAPPLSPRPAGQMSRAPEPPCAPTRGVAQSPRPPCYHWVWWGDSAAERNGHFPRPHLGLQIKAGGAQADLRSLG